MLTVVNTKHKNSGSVWEQDYLTATFLIAFFFFFFFCTMVIPLTEKFFSLPMQEYHTLSEALLSCYINNLYFLRKEIFHSCQDVTTTGNLTTYI